MRKKKKNSERLHQFQQECKTFSQPSNQQNTQNSLNIQLYPNISNHHSIPQQNSQNKQATPNTQQNSQNKQATENTPNCQSLQNNYSTQRKQSTTNNSNNQYIVKKLSTCSYCILEYLLSKQMRSLSRIQLRSLSKNQIISKAQPTKSHRATIEEICKNCNKECLLKRIAMNCCNDRYLLQMGCIEIFKFDMGKKQHRSIDWEEAIIAWTQQHSGDNYTYAARFEEIWKSRINLTQLGIYKIVVSSPDTYSKAIALFKILDEEEKTRHAIGL